VQTRLNEARSGNNTRLIFPKRYGRNIGGLSGCKKKPRRGEMRTTPGLDGSFEILTGLKTAAVIQNAN
jgi:hypothetical protein